MFSSPSFRKCWRTCINRLNIFVSFMLSLVILSFVESFLSLFFISFLHIRDLGFGICGENEGESDRRLVFGVVDSDVVEESVRFSSEWTVHQIVVSGMSVWLTSRRFPRSFATQRIVIKFSSV